MTDLFEDKAAEWDARPVPQQISEGVVRAMSEAITFDAGQTVMDFGAGTGLVASKIAAGAHHTCALAAGGQVLCWGWNLWGQMGEPKGDHRYVAPVPELAGARDLGAHGAVTCALLEPERVACLGGYTPEFFGPWRVGVAPGE